MPRWLAGALGLALIAGPAAAQLRPEDGRFRALAAITALGTAAADQQLADTLRGPGPPVLRSTADLVEPLGHATHAFALATGIAEEARRPWVTAAAYGAATLVAWSRVHDEAPWPSDVVAGAVVGTSASLTTIEWLERREARRRQPRADGGTPGWAETPPDDRTPSARVRLSPAAITVSIRF